MNRTIPMCHIFDRWLYRPGPELMGHRVHGGQVPGGAFRGPSIGSLSSWSHSTENCSCDRDKD